ncbi:MAG TPA: endonuclease domain-containing protein [Methylovirgula sp.]|jgi:very-short-patch-repair endonuclease|nr:endonuclease domain-containing protein [Methylovirgula sp.]
MAQIPRNVMTHLARRLRRSSVNAEAIVWRALRDRRSGDFKFRRQVPIGSYVVDFVCFEKRLIIEIDGPSHLEDEQKARDITRDHWLRQEGFNVLRLPNDLIIGSPDLAIQKVMDVLNA